MPEVLLPLVEKVPPAKQPTQLVVKEPPAKPPMQLVEKAPPKTPKQLVEKSPPAKPAVKAFEQPPKSSTQAQDKEPAATQSSRKPPTKIKLPRLNPVLQTITEGDEETEMAEPKSQPSTIQPGEVKDEPQIKRIKVESTENKELAKMQSTLKATSSKEEVSEAPMASSMEDEIEPKYTGTEETFTTKYMTITTARGYTQEELNAGIAVRNLFTKKDDKTSAAKSEVKVGTVGSRGLRSWPGSGTDRGPSVNCKRTACGNAKQSENCKRTACGNAKQSKARSRFRIKSACGDAKHCVNCKRGDCA